MADADGFAYQPQLLFSNSVHLVYHDRVKVHRNRLMLAMLIRDEIDLFPDDFPALPVQWLGPNIMCSDSNQEQQPYIDTMRSPHSRRATSATRGPGSSSRGSTNHRIFSVPDAS
jgi:hypothetical protein